MTIALLGAGYAYAGTSRPVLDGIDLVVPAGRVVGVVGPNDAGKSTLCLVAAGLAPASIGGQLEGSVLVDRTDTRDLTPHELAQRCGILFQNPATQLSGTALTVYEEVAFGPRNIGLGVAAVMERVAWAVSALGIEELASRDPQRLSGGQAQLVALAGVLALRPATLVLDEPTSQLDPAGTRLVGAALVRLAAGAGTAILIVEHKTSLLAALADEVVVLDAGRIVERGPTARVLSDSRLEGLGVEPPQAVGILNAAQNAGVAPRLASVDLVALEREPPMAIGAIT